MNRLRKYMTIMAIAGTILVTGVFCYMPFRELIKEVSNNTVSLKQEPSIGNSGMDAEELHENMTPASQNIESEIPAGNAKMHRTVLFALQQEDAQVSSYLWQSSEEICYVFLPGFAKDLPLQIEKISEGGSLFIGGQALEEGDVLTDIIPGEAYEFTLTNQEGEEIVSAPLLFLYSSDLPVLMLSTESKDFTNSEYITLLPRIKSS